MFWLNYTVRPSKLLHGGRRPTGDLPLAPGEGLEPPTTLVNSQPLCQLSYPGMVSIRPGQIRSRLEPPGGTPNGIRTRVDYRRLAVRMRWQFEQTSSHLAISARIRLKLQPLSMAALTLRTLSSPM